MVTHDEAMEIGAECYADVLKALGVHGLPAIFTQTGGMCAAIEARLEGGHTLLVTDAEDSLSWNRDDHRGWGVGLYSPSSEYNEGPIFFAACDDGSTEALLPLLQHVLTAARD